MSDQNYLEKYLKYKAKYLNLNQSGGGYVFILPIDDLQIQLLSIIELYNKTFNLYNICRIRNNSSTLLSEIEFQDLSDLIEQIKSNSKISALYNENSISLDKSMQINNVDKSKFIFTLRQETTKLIKHLSFPVKSIDISKFTELISINIKKERAKGQKDSIFIKDLEELLSKCDQLLGLITSGFTHFIINSVEGLDILRQATNQIINLIGNSVDHYNKYKTLDQTMIPEINSLFRKCFNLIFTELEKLGVVRHL